jgi:GMP synthase (glutamine-hydrolysing)
MAESSCVGCVAVINASHQFLHGTTTVPLDKRDPNSRTRVTKILSMTSNPEEKRKIIGDVFVKVSHFV